MTLNSVGSIAVHILNSFNNISAAISGEMYDIIRTQKIAVENYTGDTISDTSIDDKYVPAIVAFTKSDVVNLIDAQSGGAKVSLAELSVDESGQEMSAKQWQIIGESKLKALGRGVQMRRSIS